MAAIQRSTYLRNYVAVTGSYIAAMAGSFLRVYDGSVPASPDAALGAGVTQLFQISNDGTGTGLTFQAATPTNDGAVYKNTAETWKEDANTNPGALSADFARLIDGSGNVLMQMPVVIAGEGLRMAEASVVDAAEQPINGFQYILPLGTNVEESLLLRQYLVATGSYRDALHLGKLKIYADSVPASVETALSGQELLITYTNNSTATGLTFASMAVAGVLAKTATETWSGLISNPSAKTATFWRFEDSGNNAMLQGLCGGATGLILEDAAPIDGSTSVLDSFNYLIPE